MSRILINQASGKPIVEHLMVAESLAERMRGLLGRTFLPDDTGLLIRPCRSIHMWFMRFPIDAAFLDQNLRVLKVTHNLKPWQIAWAPRHTRCVLETAVGALQAVSVDDRLVETKPRCITPEPPAGSAESDGALPG